MLNLAHLLESLSPSPQAPGQGSAFGVESEEGLLFAEVLEGEGLSLEVEGEDALSLEDLGIEVALLNWVEASLTDLEGDEKLQLLESIFHFETEVDPSEQVASAEVPAFWSALHEAIMEWKGLQARIELGRQLATQNPAMGQGEVLRPLQPVKLWDHLQQWLQGYLEVKSEGSSALPETGSASGGADAVAAPVSVGSPALVQDSSHPAPQGGLAEVRPSAESGGTEAKPAAVQSQGVTSPSSAETGMTAKAAELLGEQVSQVVEGEATPRRAEGEGRPTSPEPLQAGKLEISAAGVAALRNRVLQVLSRAVEQVEALADADRPQRAIWESLRMWLRQQGLTQQGLVSPEAESSPDQPKGEKILDFLRYVSDQREKDLSTMGLGLKAEGEKEEGAEVALTRRTRQVLRAYGNDVVRPVSQILGHGESPAVMTALTEAEGPERAVENAPTRTEVQRSGELVQVEDRSSQQRPAVEGRVRPAETPSQRWDSAQLDRFLQSARAHIRLWVDRRFVAMEVQLEPADLGRMQMRTVLEQGRIGVLFQVESQAARDLLNQQVDALRETLKQQGLDVAGFEVEVRQENFSGHPEHGSKKRGSRFDMEALLGAEDVGEMELSPIVRGLINQVA